MLSDIKKSFGIKANKWMIYYIFSFYFLSIIYLYAEISMTNIAAAINVDQSLTAQFADKFRLMANITNSINVILILLNIIYLVVCIRTNFENNKSYMKKQKNKNRVYEYLFISFITVFSLFLLSLIFKMFLSYYYLVTPIVLIWQVTMVVLIVTVTRNVSIYLINLSTKKNPNKKHRFNLKK